jgi:hypothetical protein
LIGAECVARIGKKMNAYSILVGKPKGKKERSRLRWLYSINMDVRKIWTGFIWLRLGTCEHCNEPSSSIKFWKVLK